MQHLITAVITVLIGVGGAIAYFYATNIALDRVFPYKGLDGHTASRNLQKANVIRPWLFMLPAMAILGIYLVYPVIDSVWLSFHGKAGQTSSSVCSTTAGWCAIRNSANCSSTIFSGC